MKNKNIPVLVLDGGPCGGKSGALAYLFSRLSNFGFHVIVVPEAATEFRTSGLFSNQGAMSAKAYVRNFELLRRRVGLTIPELRDERYTAVFHLSSAACGAELFYTCENNRARTETAAEARVLDKRTLSAWIGHPHLRVIDNSTDFKGKLERLLREVCHTLGIPVPIEIERKLLVSPLQIKIPVPHATVDIVQHYLHRRGQTERRIRRRGQDGAWVYYYTEKTDPASLGNERGAIREEQERMLSPDEYFRLLHEQDQNTRAIIKKRTCFIWENQYFELDEFQGQDKGRVILEIELTQENDVLSLPPFLTVLQDVTGNRLFTNWHLARLYD